MAAHAVPITYDIAFIETQGIAATGVFTYDESVPDLYDLSVTWGVNPFDDLVYTDSGVCGGGASGMFAVLSMSCPSDSYFWNANDEFGTASLRFGAFISADESVFGQIGLATNADQAPSSGQAWTITPRAAAVPEASTLPLIAIGLIGLGLVVRRRKRHA